MRNRVAVVVAALITACSSSGPPAPTSAASSPTPTATTAASATPTAASASPTAPVLPTGITDLAQIFKPLASRWRPIGTTLVVARAMVSGDITLVAVPVSARGADGSPIPILSFAPAWWSLRRDGGALAVSVSTGQGARIAVWDARSGAASWLTAEEPGASAFAPMWSPDGASIYYVSAGAPGQSPRVFQIGADGSGKKLIPGSDGVAGSIQGLTPDGGGLVWSRGQGGGSVEVLDIATGINRHLENNARIQSWRARQPRALLEVGGCCAGRPGGELVAWDDVDLTSRVVAPRGLSGDPSWGVATWDPDGERVAAVRFDSASPYEGTLVLIDTDGGAQREIPGTRGAANLLWIDEGIVFTRPLRIGIEVMLLPDGQGPAVSVYQDSGLIQRIEVVRP